jgi:hypothetical protein
LNSVRCAARAGAGFALAAAALLAGCAAPPPPASTTRLYAIDLAGAARQCTAGPVSPVAGKEVAARMTVGNDGGWCAFKVSQPGPQPYSAGLLSIEPAHGSVYIHPVGDDTRIDYTPDVGYAGPDAFTATLLPGRAVIRATVSVTR